MRSRRTRTQGAVLRLTVAGLAALGLLGLAPSTAGADSGPERSQLTWAPCHEDVSAQTGVAYQCATATVPLDYDRPRGDTISVALVRIPATDPAHRIGSILFNPGGPGGSGIDFVLGFGPFAGQVYGPDVPARFDLVGFDPRGIGASTPLLCFGSLEESFGALSPVAFPVTADEERQVAAADDVLRRACRQRGGAIAEHMSTANVARDMDRIRQALGDDKLTFAGYSYGTFLGATYANLFPNRVRAMVVDGVLDPIAWVNRGGRVPFSTALRSDQGAQVTLERFFRLCEQAQPGNCALAPNPSQRYADLLASIKAKPVEIVIDPTTGETITLTYADVVSLTLGVLYDPFSLPILAELIASLESLAAAPAPAVAPASLRLALETSRRKPPPPPAEPYPNVVEGNPGVACVDTDNPDSYQVWSREGAAADRRFGYFGRVWTWTSSACARWPFADRDRYTGPFTARTANPVLIVGNLYDPATRYQGAQALRRLLPRSALLTVDVPGHTSLAASLCADAIVGRYLLDPATARSVDGTTCPAEFNPFDLVPVPAAAAKGAAPAAPGVSPEARRAALDSITGGEPGRW